MLLLYLYRKFEYSSSRFITSLLGWKNISFLFKNNPIFCKNEVKIINISMY